MTKTKNMCKQKCNGKCNTTVCKAHCCTFVSLPFKFLIENQDKLQRDVLSLTTQDCLPGYVYPIVHIDKIEKINGIEANFVDKGKQICPFLDKNKRCVVYDKRPYICRQFGTTTAPTHFLTCQIKENLGPKSGIDEDETPELHAKMLYDSEHIYKEDFKKHINSLLKDA